MNSTYSRILVSSDYRTWPNSVAAVMMTLNCFFGMFFNAGLIYIFSTDKHQKSSFNMMCIIRACNNIIVLIAAFILVYIPKSLLGLPLFPESVESLLICISLNCYLFNEFQSIYISINRFIAIYFSNYYSKICGTWATCIVNLIVLGERIVHVSLETYERMTEEKYITFSPESLTFTSLEVSPDGMVLKFGLMFLLALVANGCTFVRITLFYLNSDYRNDNEKWMRVKKNMKLFIQTILQDALFFVDNLFTYHLSGQSSHRFWFFICATFVWQSVHVMDGFIMIVFNDRLISLKRFLFGSSENVVLGVFLSGAVVYIYGKENQQRTSFNLMCAFRASNNIVVMIFCFLLVYIPGSLLGYSFLPEWLDSILICISINVYLFNEFQSIYISVNRFIAIYFPTYYNILCGFYATIFVNTALYLHRLFNVSYETYLRIEKNKYIAFSPEYLMFTSIEVYGGGLVWIGLVLFIFALSVNIFTFVRISIFYFNSNSRDNSENMRSIKKNVKLFFQTVVQDILFFIDSFFTYYMSSLIDHRFWFFICATFVWQSIHVIDGFVMIMFNDRFNILKNALTSSNSVPVSVVAEMSSIKPYPRRSPLPDVS